MTDFKLPEKYFKWAYEDRATLVRKLAAGEKVKPETLFLSFTRHNPVLISNGPAGLNGSVRGVGFVPKEEYLQETLDAYLHHINSGWREGYSEEGLKLLVTHIWSPEARPRLDFSIMGSLELAGKHSWINFQSNKAVTVLFFEPPVVSFEVRGEIEIFEDGPYHRFLNAQHDVYHRPNKEKWVSRPAYIIHIKEIYDNSATRDGFGTRLL